VLTRGGWHTVATRHATTRFRPHIARRGDVSSRICYGVTGVHTMVVVASA